MRFLIPANPGWDDKGCDLWGQGCDIPGGTFQTPALPTEGSVLFLGRESHGGHRRGISWIPDLGRSWDCCALGYEGSQLGAGFGGSVPSQGVQGRDLNQESSVISPLNKMHCKKPFPGFHRTAVICEEPSQQG